MKIVITGALGHIGSQLIRDLPVYFPDAEIVMIDNMMTQRYCSLFNLPTEGSYYFVEADVLQKDLVPIIRGADVVVHLAAITDAANSFDNKEQVEENNYIATVRVAETCSNVGCSLIHLSSTSVYGTQEETVDEDCSPEELQPQSPYAETKLKEERFLQRLGKLEDLPFVICRFGTIAGVSPGMRYHTAVNKFCWQASIGQPITVWRTALYQKRPYLALSDAIAAIAFIIENQLYDQNIYNVVTDNLKVHDIIEYIKPFVNDINVQFVDTQIMNQLSYEVLNTRFRDKGFKYSGNLQKCIADTINLLSVAGGSFVE